MKMDKSLKSKDRRLHLLSKIYIIKQITRQSLETIDLRLSTFDIIYETH